MYNKIYNEAEPKEVEFHRYVTPDIIELHNVLGEVSDIIENALTDLNINPYVTTAMVKSHLQSILDNFSLDMDDVAEIVIQSIIDNFDECEDGDIEDIYMGLLNTYFSLDSIAYVTSIPILDVNEKAYDNIERMREFFERPRDFLQCVTGEEC